MFWRRKPTVDADTEAWVLAAWGWLDGVLDPARPGWRAQLLLPNNAHFPGTPLVEHERAGHVFGLVRQWAGLTERPLLLLAQEERPETVRGVGFGITETVDALGTYEPLGNAGVVTYDPDLVDEPAALIATLAHELAHDALAQSPTAPPGGEDLEELATDLAVAHMGFGLIAANTAFSFEQSADFNRQGWSAERRGYLSEATWCFACAVFAELHVVPVDAYERHAKPSVASQIAQNRAYLRANPAIIAGLARC
jgi:hypothetical protein